MKSWVLETIPILNLDSRPIIVQDAGDTALNEFIMSIQVDRDEALYRVLSLDSKRLDNFFDPNESRAR